MGPIDHGLLQASVTLREAKYLGMSIVGGHFSRIDRIPGTIKKPREGRGLESD
jgi:hypothetical protein